jgi:chemotaxis protein MotB
LGAEQITQVRGYADQRLRKPDAPLDPSNRRISVIVEYLEKSGEEQAKPGESTSERPPAESTPSEGSPKKK